MQLYNMLKRIKNAIKRIKDRITAFTFNFYSKHKVLGVVLFIVWAMALIILVPILWFVGGWTLVVGYLICKFTGACPL